MTVKRENVAQDLCNEIFLEVEGSMSDAWISDDACTNDPNEYLKFVYGSLLALEEAREIIKKFLKRHKFKRKPFVNRNGDVYIINRDSQGKWFVFCNNESVQKRLNASEIVRYLANALEGH